MPATVDQPVKAYNAMARRWKPIDAVCSGTQGMRDQAQEYLPKEPKEKLPSYQRRLARSVLFEAFKDTIDSMTSKPFSRDITFRDLEQVPPQLEAIRKNADLAGKSLHGVFEDCFRDALKKGLSHLIVDNPALPEGLSRLDEQQLGVRPAIVNVYAHQLIGWRVQKVNGVPVLKQIRIRETVCEADGEWGEKDIVQIRVFDAPTADESGAAAKGIWRIFRQSVPAQEGEKGDWVVHSAGTYDGPRIPLFTFYTQRDGTLCATPPLEALAWANIEHWQGRSDQANVLRFARIAMLYACGVGDDEIQPLKADGIGWATVLRAKNPDAKWGFVSHDGKSIEAGQADLERIEQRMEVLGMRPFLERRDTTTATGVRANEGAAGSLLQGWVAGMSIVATDVMRHVADLLGLKLGDEFAVQIFHDFVVPLGGREDALLLLQLFEKMGLDLRTLLNELKRRGILAEDVNVDQVVTEIQTNPPAALVTLAGLAKGANGPQPGAPNDPTKKPAAAAA